MTVPGEKIDKVKYDAPVRPSVNERWETLFLTGPAEFLCRAIADQLKLEPVWKSVFGDFIDPYKRMDYGMRNLPALRIYCDTYRREGESWYIQGAVTLDMIFPPSIRRPELEQLPATFSSAMLQQFRTRPFFDAVSAKVPGLNELGKFFDVDKSLAFDMGDGDDEDGPTLTPLCQINVGMRIQIEDWDAYMEQDDREADSPFLRTLGDLKKLRISIQGVDDEGNPVGFEV